ncbi:MAG: AsnC family transcriptional regulator [Dehalococcoidales bacterium]|nr:AsnC family transcriptional regulator [Dehalococcoidales bacterium]
MVDLKVADRELLGLLQSAFPLAVQPYADLGRKLGISGDEIVRRIQELKAQGILRQIGPVLDARKLGYRSTLVAMKISPEKLERAEEIIREHPGVSHGYERGHDFNVWITLSIHGRQDIEAEVKKLASAVGAQPAMSLPVVKVFKLRAFFGADSETPEPDAKGAAPSDRVELSAGDKAVINEIQQDLALVNEPFNAMASRLGMETGEFLENCRSLLQRGIIRRYGAAVNHTKAGYKANAMACWVVPAGKVDMAGQKLASWREVSHCYERKTTNPLWRYNLFAMIHGQIRTDCEKIVEQVSNETGLNEHVTLFSTREFKKVRVKYSV